MIKSLWQHLTKRRKKQFSFLLFLMVIASVMEMISIGAVVPFLGALTAPEQVYQHHLAQPLIRVLDITDPKELLLPLTIIFIMATVVAAAVRLILLYVSTRLSFATGADISIDIYRRTLYQDYAVHTSRNSSEIINSIITKTNTVIGQVIVPILTFISAVVIMLGIIGVLFTINAPVAFATFSFFGLTYFTISYFTKKSLLKNSRLIASQSTLMVKSLQEGLGGIREVLIDGSQEFYCGLYQTADYSLRRASGTNIFIAASPRYLMEGISMILIAVLAYFLTIKEGNLVSVIPVLGAIAVGGQKLLPALQQAYSSYSTIKGAKSSFADVLRLLNQPTPYVSSRHPTSPTPFTERIVINDLSFRYSKDTPWILKNVNLSFQKGEKIGFIGETGSGKSTLIDILMGLLTPTSGDILVDGVAITRENRRAWQMHISHVPQNIYLADSAIQENIAFGVKLEEINKSAVHRAAQQAEISGVIDNLKNQYQTHVGEQGIQFSGGQRQRIGIARALYKNSDVLMFDEATSALDSQTEQKIMHHISQLDNEKTIFIIAHRLTTLKNCDRVIKINADYTFEQVDYSQIISNES